VLEGGKKKKVSAFNGAGKKGKKKHPYKRVGADFLDLKNEIVGGKKKGKSILSQEGPGSVRRGNQENDNFSQRGNPQPRWRERGNDVSRKEEGEAHR